MQKIDLVGNVYSHLTIIEETIIGANNVKAYICKCTCGNTTVVAMTNLRTRHNLGKKQSCGCMQKYWAAEAKKKHGLRYTKIYLIWKNMKSRCYNPNNDSYKDYGAKGIEVCNKWINDPKAFSDWADSTGFTEERYNSEKLSIDRKDSILGYSSNNCRWTSKSIQSRNTRIIKSTNTSGFRGVSKNGSKKKPFRSQIKVDKKSISIGSYVTAIEAAKAYDTYVINNNLEHTINGVI